MNKNPRTWDFTGRGDHEIVNNVTYVIIVEVLKFTDIILF